MDLRQQHRRRHAFREVRRSVHFNRKISRMCRIGSRSVAIALLGTRVAKEPMVEPDAQRRRRADHDAGIGDHDPWNG